MKISPVLITGAAGFIGFHLARRLVAEGIGVTGIDNLNDYYDPALKRARLAQLEDEPGFTFVRLDLCDRSGMEELFRRHRFQVVVNLAAQPGVRYSLTHPHAYGDSNLTGFLNVLEGCRHSGVAHLVFASSSSVYGANVKVPFCENDPVDHPVSLYAATKKAGELMAHSYSHLYGLPVTGLRFFTVYGPWGRPDMAYYSFTRKILAGEPLPVFNHGRMKRDFTYIDDIVEGVRRVMELPPAPDPQWNRKDPDPATSYAPFRVLNIGNNRREELLRFIAVLEDCLGKKAELEMLPFQNGDVAETYADIGRLSSLTGFAPSTTIEEGLARFVDWYREYHRV